MPPAPCIARCTGAGLAKDPGEVLADACYNKMNMRERWVTTDTLIIDEISMMSADLLSKLDTIARRLRQRPHVPFGGMQLIVCGDFLQLPPVPTQQRDIRCPYCGKSGTSDHAATRAAWVVFAFWVWHGAAFCSSGSVSRGAKTHTSPCVVVLRVCRHADCGPPGPHGEVHHEVQAARMRETVSV